MRELISTLKSGKKVQAGNELLNIIGYPQILTCEEKTTSTTQPPPPPILTESLFKEMFHSMDSCPHPFFSLSHLQSFLLSVAFFFVLLFSFLQGLATQGLVAMVITVTVTPPPGRWRDCSLTCLNRRYC